MNKGWAKLLEAARSMCGYICPLCEKPTDDRTADTRIHPFATFRAASQQRYQWKCAHCAAWNTDEKLIE